MFLFREFLIRLDRGVNPAPTPTAPLSPPPAERLPFDAVVIAPGTGDRGDEAGSTYRRFVDLARERGIPVIETRGVGAMPSIAEEMRRLDPDMDVPVVMPGDFHLPPHFSADMRIIAVRGVAQITGLGPDGVDARATEITDRVSAMMSRGALPPAARILAVGHSRGSHVVEEFTRQVSPDVRVTRLLHDPVPGPFMSYGVAPTSLDAPRFVVEATATWAPGFGPGLRLLDPQTSTVLPVYSRHSGSILPRPDLPSEMAMQDRFVGLTRALLDGDRTVSSRIMREYQQTHDQAMLERVSQRQSLRVGMPPEPSEDLTGLPIRDISGPRSTREARLEHHESEAVNRDRLAPTQQQGSESHPAPSSSIRTSKP